MARRAEAHASLDEVKIRQRIAGQSGRLGLECVDLGREPGATPLVGHLGQHAIAQRHRVRAEGDRGAALFEVDLGLEIGRAEVAIDQPGDVLVEPQREQEVVGRHWVGGRHPARAADRGHQ